MADYDGADDDQVTFCNDVIAIRTYTDCGGIADKDGMLMVVCGDGTNLHHGKP